LPDIFYLAELPVQHLPQCRAFAPGKTIHAPRRFFNFTKGGLFDPFENRPWWADWWSSAELYKARR
jgi:hypothetical protein